MKRAASPISGGLVLRLGVSQLVCWGISYYLIGVFATPITAEFGWSSTITHAGFSLALVVMGLSSRTIGRLTQGRGGRPVMVAGSCLTAIGCLTLAASRGAPTYFASWIALGLGMRMTLYDAAFASLVRLGGPAAKRPISQVTLLGGLASTTFWPIGQWLAASFGWRTAALIYAGIALLTLPLHLSIPEGRWEGGRGAAGLDVKPLARDRRERILAGALYVLLVVITTFLNTALSAHMIGILTGLGVAATAAVWISTLRGVGQSLARLTEVLFGGRMSPLALGVLATCVLPACFLAGLLSGGSLIAAITFAVVFGAGNGLSTVARGTIPLVLFDSRSYGSIVGAMLTPGFLVSAVGPIAYATVIERFGHTAALQVSAALAMVLFGAALALRLRFGGPRAGVVAVVAETPGVPGSPEQDDGRRSR